MSTMVPPDGRSLRTGSRATSCTVILFCLFCLNGGIIVAAARVGDAPEFNTTLERVTVKEGERAILPCSVEYLGQRSVIWVNPRKILISHLDRRTIDDHRISVERPYIKEWNLLIRQVRYNDSGVYECRINTKPKQSKKVILTVQVPPMIVSELSSDRVSLQEGETATLICNVTGIPKPNVTWYKRNNRRLDSKKERIGTEGEVLVIHNVTRMCDDIYECSVDNGVPPAVSKAIRVTVDYAPEVQLPNRRIGQSVGKETILDCVIAANPQAVTEWRRGDRALQKSHKYDIDVFRDEFESSVTLSLRIKTLVKSDYGQYLCVGSNHLGEDQEEMTLYEIFPTTTTTTTTTTTAIPPWLQPQSTKRVETVPGYHYDSDPTDHLPKRPDPYYGSGGRGDHNLPDSGRQGEGGEDREDNAGPHAQSSKDWKAGESRGEGERVEAGNNYQGKGNTYKVPGSNKDHPASRGHSVLRHSTMMIYVIVTSTMTSLLAKTILPA